MPPADDVTLKEVEELIRRLEQRDDALYPSLSDFFHELVSRFGSYSTPPFERFIELCRRDATRARGPRAVAAARALIRLRYPSDERALEPAAEAILAEGRAHRDRFYRER